jgi:hypothetical protein
VATIELTEEQRQILQARAKHPVDVVDPNTKQRYVLLAQEQYERVRLLLEKTAGGASPEVASDIPPGILCSQQAYWRDLPELLAQKKRGNWVLYHRNERIGVAKKVEDLIRECIRRDLADDECYLGEIAPRSHAPWGVEEIASPKFGYGQAALHPPT